MQAPSPKQEGVVEKNTPSRGGKASSIKQSIQYTSPKNYDVRPAEQLNADMAADYVKELTSGKSSKVVSAANSPPRKKSVVPFEEEEDSGSMSPVN